MKQKKSVDCNFLSSFVDFLSFVCVKRSEPSLRVEKMIFCRKFLSLGHARFTNDVIFTLFAVLTDVKAAGFERELS